MNEQKNKQQPPQGNKQDKEMNREEHKPGKQDQGKHQQGTPEGRHGKTDMDEGDQPDKKNRIDDNPDETKKKIPNMEKKH
jgi:hypothetical protein